LFQVAAIPRTFLLIGIRRRAWIWAGVASLNVLTNFDALMRSIAEFYLKTLGGIVPGTENAPGV
jgi:hypothetical protein